jgi:hypothetical protein
VRRLIEARTRLQVVLIPPVGGPADNSLSAVRYRHFNYNAYLEERLETCILCIFRICSDWIVSTRSEETRLFIFSQYFIMHMLLAKSDSSVVRVED